MARKTVKIEAIKAMVNRRIAREDLSVEVRKALVSVLEEALFDADAYQGYNDVHWIERGYDAWVEDGRPDFPEKRQYIYGGDGTDTFRRVYY